MRKFLLLGAMLLSMVVSVYAQEEEAGSGYAPAAGDFTGAVLFGRGTFLNVPNAPDAPWNNTNWTVSGQAPSQSTVRAGSNTITNMLGVEGRYFVTDIIAAKLSGGAIFGSTPERPNNPAFTSSSSNAAWIPAYEAVQKEKTVDICINIGGEYHFPSTKFERVFPYVGANFPLLYGRRTQYDPTIALRNEIVEGQTVQVPYAVDVGLRHSEVFGWGIQAVAGIDYYLQEALYMGFEFKPISYLYTYSNKLPAPGLPDLEANNHTWAFFSQIYFKVGFKF